MDYQQRIALQQKIQNTNNRITDLTTDNITEGSVNLYFTESRARSSISVSATGLNYSSSTGVISLNSSYVIPTTLTMAALTSASHSHTNKSVLDATQESLTTALKANYDAAYGWGNHASAGYLTAESDPVFLAWDKSTGISITASQVSDFDTEVSNNTDVAANTSAKHTHSNKANLDTINQNMATTDSVAFYAMATSITHKYRGTSYTSDDTIELNEGYVIINSGSGNVTATLPSVGSDQIGHEIIVYNWSSSNTALIARGDSDTIEAKTGSTSGTQIELTNAGDWVKLLLVWTTRWKIIDSSTGMTLS